MDNLKVISVADFATIPGARYRTDGDNSAQEFFEDVVKEIADAQLLNSSSGGIMIDLDYTRGYPSSFISELSKSMSINYKKVKKIKKRLIIKSEENPGLIERFWDGFKQKYS